jgi:DNA-binding winged helix-turn-helix (wHTH) protein
MEAALSGDPSWRGFAQARAPGLGPALWSAQHEAITLTRVTQRLRFSHYLIDLAARELRDDGRLLQLSPKIFDCIAYLIENRERAVGRDELMAAVWGRADTADTQLGQAMLKARRALGDSGDAQHTIRTVAGFGYRWVANVHAADGDEAVASVPLVEEPAAEFATEAAETEIVAAPVRATPPNARRWPLLLAASLALLLAVGAFAWQRHRSQAPAQAANAAAAQSGGTVAVLPAVLDADADSAWLRLGMMDLVAGRLRSAGLTVAPSENVVSATRAAKDDAAVAESVRAALDPRWLVAPTARKTDAGWVVSLELRERDGKPREIGAKGADAIAATRAASERLLDLFGRHVQDEGAAKRPFDEWLPRIDAALLVDDLETARRLLQAAPPERRRAPDVRLREALVELGAGRFDIARADLDRLLDEVPAETDPVLRARILSSRGAALVRLGRSAEAEATLGDALVLLEGRAEPALLGKTHMRRGVARSLLGRYDQAVADFAQARLALQLAADTLGAAQVELNEGALNGVRNHPADALQSFQRAEAMFARFGLSAELVNALVNQIVAHRVLLQPAEALAVSERSLALLGRLPSPDLEHLLKLRRAQAFADVGRWSDANMLLDELARAIDPLREPELAAMTANGRAELALARGRADEALQLVAPIVEQLLDPGFASTRAEAWFTAIRALHALHRDTEAADSVRRFAAWSAQSGNSTFVIHARLAEAEQAVAERRFADADRLYADALHLAGTQNIPADIADVARSYGSLLIARGELARAAPVVGQVAGFAGRDFGCALLQVRLYHALGQNEAWRSALEHARSLSAERAIPVELTEPPTETKIGRSVSAAMAPPAARDAAVA